MEAFSLLKYWRVGSGGGGSTTIDAKIRTTSTTATATETTTTTVREMAIETVEEADDEGPFFDLEFAVPDEDGENENEENDDDYDDDDDDDSSDDEEENDTEGTDGEPEFNFTVSPDSSGGRTDASLTFSPSDDLFFKGKLVPLEPSSIVFNQSETNSNNKAQFPVSLFKTATKFRVFMLGFKKPKSTATEKVDSAINGATPEAQKQQQQQQSKFLTVKLKVEEVPIISLFTRDNSSKISGNKNNKQSSEDVVSSDEKKFSKDVVQKYLKMIKPLYVRVSKRYGEKLGFSGQLSIGSGKTESIALSTTPTKEIEVEKDESEGNLKNVSKIKKQGNLPTGLQIVRKHLGKSRSASSAVAAVTPVGIQAKRQDDSLLQQQDGIQSAILHCKRSFNSSRETDSDSSPLSRSSSDQTHGK